MPVDKILTTCEFVFAKPGQIVIKDITQIRMTSVEGILEIRQQVRRARKDLVIEFDPRMAADNIRE